MAEQPLLFEKCGGQQQRCHGHQGLHDTCGRFEEKRKSRRKPLLLELRQTPVTSSVRILALTSLALISGHLALASSVALTGSPSPAVFGQPVTLTATITPGTATGHVTFYDGATVLGTSPVSNGIAAFTTSLMASGTPSLRGYYGGDANNTPGMSGVLPVTVTPVPEFGYLPRTSYSTGNSYPSLSVSVATVDLNGDGKTDLVVGNATANNISVLLGNGDGTFQPAVNYAAGTYSISIAVGDFNGDGKPDVAVANSNNVSILFGNGDGTLRPAVNYAAGASPNWISVSDFNGDGKADLAVVDSGSNSVGILLGNGDGTFQPLASFSAGATPLSLAVADFNGDGKPDLAVANSGFMTNGQFGSGSISILLGNGDGTFRAAVSYSAPVNPGVVVVGDLNGDGKADLAVSNVGGGADLALFMGNGDGTFQVPATLSLGFPGLEPTTGIAICDANGDGVADLAITLRSNTGDGYAALYLGTGNGAFQYDGSYDSAISPNGKNIGFVDSVVTGDFNGDGRVDLAITLQGDLTVLLGSKPTLTITLESSLSAATNGQNVTLTATVSDPAVGGVITFSEKPNVIGTGVLTSGKAVLNINSASPGAYTFGASYAGNSAYAFSASAPLTQVVNSVLPSGPAMAANYPTGFYPPLVLAKGDFNGDGQTDLAVAYGYYSTGGGSEIGILLGNSDGTFQPVAYFPSGSDPVSVAVADFNGDGKADIVAANVGGTVNILLGNGDGTFRAPVAYSTGNTAYSVAVADFNGDGKADLAVANYNDRGVSVLLGNGDGTFQTAKLFSADSSTPPVFVAVGDFNSDGKPDLVTANGGFYAGGNDISVLLGNGDGTFRTAVNYTVGANPTSVAVADFNGDGHVDVAVSDSGSNNVSVLLSNGQGQLAAATTCGVGNTPVSVAAGDFNGDGITDLVVGNELDNTLTLLTGNGDGTFVARSAIPDTGSGPDYILAGHFIADGGTDIAVANGNSGNVGILTGVSVRAIPMPTGGIANAASASQAPPSVVSAGSYIAIYGTGVRRRSRCRYRPRSTELRSRSAGCRCRCSTQAPRRSTHSFRKA
jgi:hypothetical protein